MSMPNVPNVGPHPPSSRLTKGRYLGVPKALMKDIIGYASHVAWLRCAKASGKLKQSFGKIRKMRKVVMKEIMADIVNQLVK